VDFADGALVGIVQVTAQRVQRLALVELPGDLAPVDRVGQVLRGMDRAAQRAPLLQRGGEGVVLPCHGQHVIVGALASAAKGYAAVGVNEVLAAAGVPEGSFYHYFGSEDAFGEAMMKSYPTAMDWIVPTRARALQSA
jgi:hypothetical protein